MKLDSAQSLKKSLLSKMVAPMASAASRGPSAPVAAAAPTRPAIRTLAAIEGARLGVSAQDRDNVPKVHRSIAIGVAPGKRTGQYRLAVRVQRQSLLASPLVEEIVRTARGEAEVRFVGRIAKRAAADQWYRSRVRPLMIGASIGHFAVTAGTIGGFVTRGKSKTPYLLSNNHVLANENEAGRGDAITQPGTLDRGRVPRDQVGRLAYWVRLKANANNAADCALAALADGIDFEPALLTGVRRARGTRLAGVGPDFLDAGAAVYKVGRTTGPTRGRVTAFDVDNVVVNYDMGNLTFDNQLEIEGVGRYPFSDGGDSGSLIVDRDSLAVALLFAGGETGGRNGLGLTYGNPLHTVLKALNAKLLLAP